MQYVAASVAVCVATYFAVCAAVKGPIGTFMCRLSMYVTA